jgi:TrmH family RNA methyltransferase
MKRNSPEKKVAPPSVRISKAEVKYLRSFHQKKVRHQEKKFLLEGWRALKEALHAGARMEYIGVLPRFLDDPDYADVFAELARRRIEVKELTEMDLNAIADTVHAQGVVALVDQTDHRFTDRHLHRASLIVAADAITDPGNVGSILRTCDWFGVDILLLGKGCVELYNDKVVRSTVGSIFHLTTIEGVNLPYELQRMKEKGFSIVGLSADGKIPYQQYRYAQKSVLVVGSEARGISKEIRSVVETTVRIPRYGQAESLNVGVACGIVLAHLKGVEASRKNSTPSDTEEEGRNTSA